MSISIPGILVCLVLVALGLRLRAPLIVPLLAAVPFGSTAIATVSALSGSSPLIYVVFALALVAATLVRRHLLSDIRRLFVADWATSVLVILLIYVVGSSFILPRMFAGQTTAFVTQQGRVVEVMLAPNNGNITQVGYFALGCLIYLSSSIYLLNPRNFRAFKLAFFSFTILNAALGLVDLMSKLSGAGDLLLPIRTASYQLLTNVEEAGFWRIAGGFPEASSFAAAALAGLGFAFGYWRAGKSTPVLVLAMVLLALILLSTSTTAYVACALVAAPVAVGVGLRGLAGRLRSQDLAVLAIIAVCLAGGMGIAALNRHIVDQIVDLFQNAVLNKAQSSSGQERGYWNSQSIASLYDTWGLGVGFGSSRASSWIVALVSQTGLVGALLMAALVLRAAWPLKARRGDDMEMVALYGGVRGCVLAGIVAVSVSAGSADPGLVFFTGLAVCGACRRQIMERRTTQRERAMRVIPARVRSGGGLIPQPARWSTPPASRPAAP
jgi:hypothetical protein